MERLSYFLLLTIADYLEYSDIASWALTCRGLERAITPVLYNKPRAYAASLGERTNNQLIGSGAIDSRAVIVLWAAKHGRINTIKKVVASEDIVPYLPYRVHRRGYQSELGVLGMTPMHQAALHGQIEIINYLVELGASVNCDLGEFMTPIYVAQNKEVMRCLIKHGATVNNHSNSRLSPLAFAIHAGADASAVQYFLELGCDPNAVYQHHFTAGDVAIWRGSLEILETLLKAGLDVSDPIPPAGSLISRAIKIYQSPNPELALRIVTLLLDYGAPAEGGRAILDRRGRSASHKVQSNVISALVEKDPNPMIELLLSRGARAETGCSAVTHRHTTWSGHWMNDLGVITPLDRLSIAMNWSSPSSVAESFSTMSLFIAHDPSSERPRKVWSMLLADFMSSQIRRWDETGEGKLIKDNLVAMFMFNRGFEMLFEHHSISKEERLELLLKSSNLLIESDMAPLLNSIKETLKMGIDLNSPRKNTRRTWLMDACDVSRSVYMCEIIKLFISHGADINQMISYANEFPGCYRERELFPRNALEALLWDADDDILCRETVDRLEALLSYGTLDVNPPGNGRYSTPLLLMTRVVVKTTRRERFRNEIISLLLRHGADIEARSGSWLDMKIDNQTPNSDRLVSISGDFGPVLSATHPPSDPGNILYMQARMKQLKGEIDETVILGTSSEWKLDFPDQVCDGGTALHFAAICCDLGAMKVLLDYNTDALINARSTPGFTPLMVLVIGACNGMIDLEFVEKKKLLLDRGADISLVSVKGQTAWDMVVESQPSSLTGPIVEGLRPGNPLNC